MNAGLHKEIDKQNEIIYKLKTANIIMVCIIIVMVIIIIVKIIFMIKKKAKY